MVWTLDDKGFNHIESSIKNLEVRGYKSENFQHDFLVTVFLLGESLTHQPEFTRTYSEQKLRRTSPNTWPEYFPTSILHRPDGYSMYFQDEKQVIVAFEVELNLKAKNRYEPVVTFFTITRRQLTSCSGSSNPKPMSQQSNVDLKSFRSVAGSSIISFCSQISNQRAGVLHSSRADLREECLLSSWFPKASPTYT